MKPVSFANALYLLLPVLASAMPAPITGRDIHSRGTSITAQQIIAIAPGAAQSCASRADKNAPTECADAEQAATNIAKSFEKYQVTSPAEQAAVISLLALESVEFLYNRNKVPGVAGQGTRNMQSPAFNSKYAASLNVAVSSDAAQTLDKLVENLEWDFGSGAWFLTTQCSADVRSALQAGSEAGWQRYITECVQTQVTDQRKEYWQKAVKALGVQSS
ncbi:hypothetical protein BDV32DRAFT_106531 [Aspergillus pseudonomiae]|uniref:Uncharacterized protein n=1 Tax=Aspergillus pseudonomiae TaxID=1506151 RepID=A0A5N7CX17_9EURO|nr:uncharacterized protein BDV37DRAFT_33679 [Aspergillus pseudonomiae]KAB8256058.1 hypothetical protein BDV32DRAFT_106531 [Aspergillus pseudonomiae]KAE8398317.1 hypothetical protein BDV37DRAFT_33679 [Aspergillus pseudonomiae]